MSAEDDAIYSKELFLFTLSGWITLYFTDGHTLEGEVTTQDELNIFLTIDGQPYMIPRSQIRYIKGGRGQQIVKDISQQAVLEAEPVQVDAFETRPPETAEMATPVEISADRVEVAGVEYGDDDGGTYVIEPEMDDFSTTKETGAPAPVVDALEDTGFTYVLEDSAELLDDTEDLFAPPEPDLGEATIVLEEEEEQITARLVCTAGPHADEEIELSGGVVTIGRATNNDFPLSKDKEVSRRHAIIEPEMGRYVIQDQNSLNGTFVNNERVQGPRFLKDGDLILIGVSYLEYRE